MTKYFVELTKGEWDLDIVGHGYMANVREPQILTPSGDIVKVRIYQEFEKKDMAKYAMTKEQVEAINHKFMVFAVPVEEEA
ncbi:hypothetical protein [Lactococcus ileimucosae]|uniref:hypothetical protein n=1 Tax=Lactococcus ileimucosae TaxID=2941329 RepID=UPI0035121D75